MQVVAADILRVPPGVPAVPAGTPVVAMLRNLLQILAPDEVATALRYVSGALPAKGVLYVSGEILDDDRTTPAEAAAINLVFVNLYAVGQAYTESEYRRWLTEAGLVDVERLAEDLIRARLPDEAVRRSLSSSLTTPEDGLIEGGIEESTSTSTPRSVSCPD